MGALGLGLGGRGPAGPAGPDDSLQGEPVSATPPSTGDVLTYDGSEWAPAAPASTSRRASAEATTRLLWECQEASGDVLNTGSLGSAGDLDTVGSGVTRRSLAPYSTLGPGLTFDGTSDGHARGAAGQVVGDGSAVTLWAVVVPHSLAAKRYVLARDWGATWTDPYLAVSLALGPAGLSVRANRGGAPGDGFEFDSGVFVIDRQYLIGLTYDGATLRAYVNGLLTGSTAAPSPGPVDWGDPAALWRLGERDGGERAHVTILRAGAEASVWPASRWAEEYARINGHPVTV